MSRQNSDADLYLETLTRCAASGNDTHMRRLNTQEVRMVLANRMAYTRLMLGLAVKLEAGVKPAIPAK